MWNQSFNPALICTLPDLCSFLGAAACADVLYRRPPTTTSTHPPSLPRPCEPGQQPNINNNHSACFHLSYPALSFTGAATLQHAPPPPPVWTCLAPTATERRSPAQREVRARRPGQPTATPAALVHTHLHRINACPLILAGPFIKFLTASVQPPNRAQEKKRHRDAKSRRSIFALSWEKNLRTTRTRRVARKKQSRNGSPTFRLSAVPE